MSYISGYRQYLAVDGGVAGIITGGGARDAHDVHDFRGIGSHWSQGLREGLLRPEGSCSIMVQSKTLLEKASRNVNGTLDVFEMSYGDADQDGFIHHSCKLNSLRLSFRGAEPLQTDVSWRGLWFEDGGTSGHATGADNVLMFYQGVIAGLAGAEVYGGEISINNNVDWLSVIDSTLSDKIRRAKYMVEGPAIISANFRISEYYGVDISADSIAYIPQITVVFTGDNTVDFTLTNCKAELRETPFTPQGVVEHGVSVKASSFTIA